MADIKKLFELSGMELYTVNGIVNQVPLIESYRKEKDEKKKSLMLQNKLINDAMVNFKRKAMGYFETVAYKSREEMIQLMHDTKLYSDKNRISSTLDSLIGKEIQKPVNDWHILWTSIRFNKLKNPQDDKSYEIEAYIPSWPVRYNF